MRRLRPGTRAKRTPSRAAAPTPDLLAGQGIDDVVEHVAKLIGTFAQRPILVGHSLGGLVVQKLLGRDLAVAAIAIDAAPIKGVPPVPLPISAIRSTLPVLRNPANVHRAVSLTEQQFRYAFGNAISGEQSRELHRRWSIPTPGKPLFEAAVANCDPHSPAKVDTDNTGRGPLLLIAGAGTTSSPRRSPVRR